MACLCDLGIEGVVDVGRDFLSVLGGAFFESVLGHRLGDETRKLRHGPIADERPRIILVGAFAGCSVTLGALLTINLLATALLGGACTGRQYQRQSKERRPGQGTMIEPR